MEEKVRLFYLAGGAIYLAYAVLEAAGLATAAGWALAAAAVAHAAMLLVRGVAIGFFPLTNKFESFTCFSAAVIAVLLVSRGRGGRAYRLGLFAPAGAFYGLASLFPMAITYPPPLMLTVWYPLHVPTSFLSYALWASAAVKALAGPAPGEAPAAAGRDPLIASHILWGFILWSLSMFFGGLWGYVAWGHHFLWDQKILWSVILWLYYSVLVHLDHWPAAARWRGFFAVLGFAFVLMAYVGTSFLTGSSHSF